MQRIHSSKQLYGARRRSLRRVGRTSVAGLLLLVAGGCQSYERRPLDVAGHHADFLARTPESPEVRAFAETLATSSAKAPDDPTIVFNPTDGIACDEAEVIALVFNADLRLSRLKADLTRATAENSGLWEDPTVGVDLARIIESTPEPWKVFTSLGITIPISGRLEIEKQRATFEHAAELARVAEREWSVRMDVRRAWSEWSAIAAQLAATRDFIERVDQILMVVDKMEQAGEMTRTESRLFRIERATKGAEFAMLESQARERELRLRQLMGISPDAPLQLIASGVGPSRAMTRLTALKGADIPALKGRSPRMLVAMADYEAAEKALEREVRKQFPDLHIGPGLGREDGQDQALLGLSVPIPLLNANRQGIAEARAQRQVARAAVEGTLEQIIANLRSAEVRLAAAIKKRQTLESEIIPLVDAQYADARQVARLGEVNTLVLLESLTKQQEAKIGLVEAARDEALAKVDLEELIGPEPMGNPRASDPSHPINTSGSETVRPNSPTSAPPTTDGSAR